MPRGINTDGRRESPRTSASANDNKSELCCVRQQCLYTSLLDVCKQVEDLCADCSTSTVRCRMSADSTPAVYDRPEI